MMNQPSTVSDRMPTYYLSHGGGPWPYLQGEFRERFVRLEASLRDIARNQLPQRPTAVLVVSGHWEEPAFTVSTSRAPGMVFDYYGFPEHTYRISYPAPGSPALADRVRGLLGNAGWSVDADADRGFDHGTFSMMQPMYPDADVPVVQLSLKRDFDPAEHLAAGRALAPLRDEGVLIIGSGMSYHNLRMLGPAATEPSIRFDRWLRQTLSSPPEVRRQQLESWETAPAARIAHPSEDHLLPLMVAVGAAGDDPATCVYGEMLGQYVAASSFRFGADQTPAAHDVLSNPA